MHAPGTPGRWIPSSRGRRHGPSSARFGPLTGRFGLLTGMSVLLTLMISMLTATPASAAPAGLPGMDVSSYQAT